MPKPTPEQNAIIYCPTDRNVKVIAVAGSGKSTTMAIRIKHLINEGFSPQKIIVLMFNKSAQIEFQEKLDDGIGKNAPRVKTYHALGIWICQQLAKHGALPRMELDASEYGPIKLAKEALEKTSVRLNLPNVNINNMKLIESFVSFVDLCKSTLDKPSLVFTRTGLKEDFSYFINAFEDFEHLRKNFPGKKTKGKQFFSDLIYDPVKFLHDNPEYIALIANKSEHIIIDEFQDINDISIRMIKLIAGKTAIITAVGDPDQCLYEFRGSRPSYIVDEFETFFKDPIVFKMSRTFRYNHPISLAANGVITNNSNRMDNLCISGNCKDPSKINLLFEDEKSSEKTILDAINKALAANWKYSDVSILVRTFSMAPPIEIALLENNVPYNLEGGDSVLSIPEIDCFTPIICAGLFPVKGVTPNELNSSLYHFLTVPFTGLSFQRCGELAGIISELLLTNNIDKNQIQSAADAFVKDDSDFIKSRVKSRLFALESIALDPDTSPGDKIQWFINETRMYEGLKKAATREQTAENQIVSITSFLDYVYRLGMDSSKLIEHLSKIRNEKKSLNDGDCILVTSCHRSKGLEWPVVILPYLYEGGFPYERRGSSMDIESERRLFYVAMTRAINELFLISPNDPELIEAVKTLNDKPNDSLTSTRNTASRFLYEANLKLANVLGEALQKGQNPPSINAISADIGNEYLRSLGLPETIKDIN